MSNVFDQSGQFLGALPSDAVRVNSSLLMLTGKYVDSDGIIYDKDGTVNESATAAYAREVAAQRTSQPYTVWDAAGIKKESVQENSEADSTRAEVDAFFSNVYQTGASIPGYAADAVGGAWTVTQWIIVGLVAIAVLQVADKVPSQGRIKKYARRKVKEYRKHAARYVEGR